MADEERDLRRFEESQRQDELREEEKRTGVLRPRHGDLTTRSLLEPEFCACDWRKRNVTVHQEVPGGPRVWTCNACGLRVQFLPVVFNLRNPGG